MNRREAIKTGLVAGLGSAAPITGKSEMTAESNHYYELRFYELRNDIQPGRIQEFFQQYFMPAMKRQGVGPIGCFTVVSGLSTPSLLVFVDYKSLAEMQSVMEALRGDKEFAKGWQAFEAAGEMPYVRYEKTLLRAFDNHQKTEVPAMEDKRQGRLFELRTYESRSLAAARNKIEMFNQEEIKIFRDSGFATVFFGEAIAGTRLPHLTYLVGFDNMAARDKAWDAFRVNPDWARVKNKPGWTDAEAVSSIHSAFLRPTNYSQIR